MVTFDYTVKNTKIALEVGQILNQEKITALELQINSGIKVRHNTALFMMHNALNYYPSLMTRDFKTVIGIVIEVGPNYAQILSKQLNGTFIFYLLES